MTDNTIQLNNNDERLIIKIQDENGNDTGNTLEFNLGDIELPLRYQELLEQDKKNRLYLRNQLAIIEKKEDHKGKKLLSANEEAGIKAMMEFFKKEKDIYDMFLGKGGVDKLLNGRTFTWTSLAEVDEIISKQIMPLIEQNAKDYKQIIMDRYGKKGSGMIE